jgi:hypothetical protein
MVHVGIACKVVLQIYMAMRHYKETLSLSLIVCFEACLDGGRNLSWTAVDELVVFYTRYFDVVIDAVKRRPRDALMVLCDGAC